jgi:hypothetical protein
MEQMMKPGVVEQSVIRRTRYIHAEMLIQTINIRVMTIRYFIVHNTQRERKYAKRYAEIKK